MIGKTLQNNNFRETTQYVLDKEKARLLGGTVMGHNSDTISQEFRMSRSLNPAIERPVYHLIDSYSYSDAATKNLSDDFLLARAIEHFAGLVVSAREPELLRQEDKTEYKQKVNTFIDSELYEYQWFCAAHQDTKHRHTHFVVSRINLIDGHCIPTWQDRERSHRICRLMEQEYELQPLKSYYEIERRSPTRQQMETWKKTGIPPIMVQLQEAIDLELKTGQNLEQLQEALRLNHGIESKLTNSHGKPGIVFEKQEDTKDEIIRMSGSQLGRGYTLSAIQQRLEKEINIEPPGLESPLQQTVEPDPLEDILRVQNDYAQRLAPYIKRIWNRTKTASTQPKTISFENYQIRLAEEGHPELYRRDRLLLAYSQGTYQGHGLMERDCLAVEQFDERSQQQAQSQHTSQEDLQRQRQVFDQGKPKPKGKGSDLSI